MDWAAILAFNLALLAALASPGPALLFAVRMALVRGWREAALAGAGLGLVAAMWTGLALLGLGGLFAAVPLAYGALKLGGAAYLLWVAWRTWAHAREEAAAPDRSGGRAFRGGVGINLANPKSVLFAAAVLVVIFPPGLHLAEKALIVANHALVEMVFYGALGAALGRPFARARYLAMKTWLDRFAALVMGALGLRLLVERGP